MHKTIFEQIRDREIPSDFVYEDEDVMAIHDIHPTAPVHILIIPKVAHPTLESLPIDDPLQFKLIKVARRLARQFHIDQNYKLVMNVGSAIQEVQHVHLHLMGGWAHPDKEAKIKAQ